jgi:hypothetical protein
MAHHLNLVRRGLRFIRARPREAVVVARMAFGVAAFSALVRLFPLPRALSILSSTPPRPAAPDAGPSDERLAQLLDAVLALDVLCFTPICWKRAAVLHRELALRGRETRVLFGVRKEGGGLLSGHAWLESGGQPIFESDPPQYAVTYSFPP